MECLKAIDLKDTPTGPGLGYLLLSRRAAMLGMTVTEYEAMPRDKAEALVMVAWHDRTTLNADRALEQLLRGNNAGN